MPRQQSHRMEETACLVEIYTKGGTARQGKMDARKEAARQYPYVPLSHLVRKRS